MGLKSHGKACTAWCWPLITPGIARACIRRILMSVWRERRALGTGASIPPQEQSEGTSEFLRQGTGTEAHPCSGSQRERPSPPSQTASSSRSFTLRISILGHRWSASRCWLPSCTTQQNQLSSSVPHSRELHLTTSHHCTFPQACISPHARHAVKPVYSSLLHFSRS